MKRKIFLALLMLVLFAACSFSQLQMKTKNGFAMDTLIRISVYSNEQKILDEAFNLLAKLDNILSMYKRDSEISKINSDSGIKKFHASDELVEVIKNSLRVYEITGGVFNPLIGPVTQLWKINRADDKIPDKESLERAVKLSDISNLEIEDNNIYLKNKGCVIDLGGIAKGYAGEKISAMLKDSGVESALIDLGGNIQTLGTKPGGSKWNIGIRDPKDPHGKTALVVSVSDTAVITSGGYERYKIINGKKYSHFFDVKTGESITNDLLSVTVITPDGSLADGLATAFMAAGFQRSLEILKNVPDSVGVIFIRQTESGTEIFATKNLKDLITRSMYKVKLF